ncbi:MAG TPA: anti-sigma factor [Allosphingosinicella sp.]|jgi:anti-sigma factor RsiW|nr:anti-sigma factor [Allosphingosinicella sp.]
MSGCPDRMILLHGLLDGELDAVNSVAIEAHLKSCESCAEELRRLEALRAGLAAPALRYKAPGALRDRIEAMVSAEAPARPSRSPSRPVRTGPWLAGGAFTAVAASVALLLASPQLTTVGIQDQLVSSHVRSLLANHLTDVATSNRHVVKPWFAGRIDFAPPVVELAGQGFPLVGGRLDYLDGHVVAAIVYRRNLHTINLFVMRQGGISSPVGFTTRRAGYNLVRWTKGGFEFWAVSDVEAGELELFHRTFAEASK